MKIGIVLPSTPGYSETFFNNKINGLQQHGHVVTLFVNSDREKSFDRCKTIEAPKLSGNLFFNIFFSFWTVFKLFLFHFSVTKKFFFLDSKDKIGLIKRFKSIIINSHILSEKLDWLHFGFGTMAIDRENVAEAIGAKMAVSFRGFDIGIYPIKHPGCYQKVWQKVDKIHVISDDIAELVFRNGFTKKGKIEKICPAIDTSYFENSASITKTSCTQILTIARLHWKKGLDYTLEALAILQKKGIDFHYTIIGEGREMERLQFLVHQLGLHNKVTFAGKLAPDEVKKLLKNIDLYIQYSVQEGFCNAVLEAQAMGKICIVSDAEGLSENVLHSTTGFVIEKRNPVSLSNKITEINSLVNDEKIRISNNAIKRVKNQFSLEKQLEEFVAFYKN